MLISHKRLCPSEGGHVWHVLYLIGRRRGAPFHPCFCAGLFLAPSAKPSFPRLYPSGLHSQVPCAQSQNMHTLFRRLPFLLTFDSRTTPSPWGNDIQAGFLHLCTVGFLVWIIPCCVGAVLCSSGGSLHPRPLPTDARSPSPSDVMTTWLQTLPSVPWRQITLAEKPWFRGWGFCIEIRNVLVIMI